MESPMRVPTVISKEAREAAECIDDCIDDLLASFGIVKRELRPHETSSIDCLAKFVQHAINRSFQSYAAQAKRPN